MLNLFSRTPKVKTVPQRLKDKEDVSLEEISEYIKETLPPEEADRFFKNLQAQIFPVVVERLIYFKDQGTLSETEFMDHLRKITKEQLD